VIFLLQVRLISSMFVFLSQRRDCACMDKKTLATLLPCCLTPFSSPASDTAAALLQLL
jgi:hypothetical protein